MQRKLLTLGLTLVMGVAGAAARGQLLLGSSPRALGMGGFTALADDVYSASWNPAGVARLKGFHATPFSLSLRFTGAENLGTWASNIPTNTQGQVDLARKLGATDTRGDVAGNFALGFQGFALTILPYGSFGIAPRSSTGAVGLDYEAGGLIPKAGSSATIGGAGGVQTILSFGKNLNEKTSAGVNLRYTVQDSIGTVVGFNGSTGGIENAATVTKATDSQSNNFSMDFGVLREVHPNLTFSASLQNLFRHNVQGGLPTQLNVGLAYRPLKKGAVVVADLAGLGSGRAHLNLGAEWSLSNIIALRMGIYQGRYTIGASVFRQIHIAYAPDNSMLSIGIGN